MKHTEATPVLTDGMFYELVSAKHLLIETGLARSRTEANRLIKEGAVFFLDLDKNKLDIDPLFSVWVPLNEPFWIRCGRKWAKPVIYMKVPKVHVESWEFDTNEETDAKEAELLAGLKN